MDGAQASTKGYTYSYDMLGEAARRPRRAALCRGLCAAIGTIAGGAAGDMAATPGFGGALRVHPRYDGRTATR